MDPTCDNATTHVIPSDRNEIELSRKYYCTHIRCLRIELSEFEDILNTIAGPRSFRFFISQVRARKFWNRSCNVKSGYRGWRPIFYLCAAFHVLLTVRIKGSLNGSNDSLNAFDKRGLISTSAIGWSAVTLQSINRRLSMDRRIQSIRQRSHVYPVVFTPGLEKL